MKKKVILGIVITLLIAGIVAGSIIIILNQNKENKQLQETDETQTQETLPSPSITKGENLTISKTYSLPNNEKVYTYMTVTITENDNEYSLSDCKFEIPQINIQSDDVDTINKAILKKFEDIINSMEKGQYIDFNCEGLEYDYFENDDILSLVMYMPTGSGGLFGCDVYNINTTTGEKISGEQLIQKLNITKDNLSINIQKSMNNYVEKMAKQFNISKTDTEFWTRIESAIQIAMSTEPNNHTLFLNDANHLCIYISTVNLGLAGGDGGTYLFDLETQENFFYYDEDEENIEQPTSIFEKNSNVNYTSNLKDDINGKVAVIKMGEKEFQSQMKDGYYVYEDNFSNTYNIKQITNIESEFIMMSNNNDAALYKVIITYEDNDSKTNKFESAVIVSNDSNYYSDITTPYLNFTGSTRFVQRFTDLYNKD